MRPDHARRAFAEIVESEGHVVGTTRWGDHAHAVDPATDEVLCQSDVSPETISEPVGDGAPLPCNRCARMVGVKTSPGGFVDVDAEETDDLRDTCASCGAEATHKKDSRIRGDDEWIAVCETHAPADAVPL